MIYIICIIFAILVALYWWFDDATPTQRAIRDYKRLTAGQYTDAANAYQGTIQNLHMASDPYKYKLMGDLYLGGIPETYDVNGNIKTPGIAPDVRKAVECYQLAIANGHASCYFDIANIHHWGVPGYDGNKQVAHTIYLEVANNPRIDDVLRTVAVERLKQLDKELGVNIQYLLPGNIGMPPMVPANVQTAHVPRKQRGVPRQAVQNILPQRRQRHAGQHAVQPAGNTTTDTIRLPDHMRNDMHNTHDHGVVNTIRTSIQKIRDNTPIQYNVPETLIELRRFAEEYLKGDKRKNAIRVLDHVEKYNGHLMGANTKEIELIHLVWNRIHAPQNMDRQSVMKENLADELAECVEHGKIVCTTGRFNRILDSINVVDPAVQIKPEWVMRKEMLDKAAAIRTQMVEADARIGVLVEKVTPDLEEQQLLDAFTEKLKGQIRETVKKDYVDSGILTQERVDGMVGEWIDDI